MKRIEYKIKDSKLIGDSIVWLNLAPKYSEKFINFRPGQYGLLSFLRGTTLLQERPFSFLSSPIENNSLQFGFKIFGKFTSELAELKEGDSVFIRGPYGAFVFDERKHKDVVFLAAGIGITPFISVIRYASELNLSNKLTLIFSNRMIKGTPFFDEIKGVEKRNPNFKAIFAFTNETVESSGEFVVGRLNEAVILNAVKSQTDNKYFFICGPGPFSDSMREILKKLGVKDKNIKTEGFTFAPRSFFEIGTWAFPIVAGASALLMLMSYYFIYQADLIKFLSQGAASNVANVNKISQMLTVNKQLVDLKNTLLSQQKADTKIVKVMVPVNSNQQNSVLTIPSQASVSVPSPTPYVPPPPRTTVS